MIFVSLSLAPNPQSPFSHKSIVSSSYYYVNSQIFRDVRAIAHSKRSLAVSRRRTHLSATLSRVDDVARQPLRDPQVRNRRKLRPWSLRPLHPQPEEIGEGYSAQLKQENEYVSHASSEMNGVSDSLISHFDRYRSYDGYDVAGELQTSIVSYKKIRPWRSISSRFQVDLVSVYHLADIRYYEILQERLRSYDCVLYELVIWEDNLEQQPSMKEELDVENDMEKYNISLIILVLLYKFLDLFPQQSCLHYKGHNWYNADLDGKTFQSLQERRKTLLEAAGDAVGSAQKSDFGLSSVLFSSDSFRSKLRRLSWAVNMPLAVSLVFYLIYSASQDEDDQQMDDFGRIFRDVFELGIGSSLKAYFARNLTSPLTDLDMHSVIIGERNKAAIEELKKAISRGEKRIAILYGADHMPDFDRRLRHEFKMVPTNVDWVTAWSITRPNSKFSGPFGMFLPYSQRRCRTLVWGSILCGLILLDFSLWWLTFGVGCYLIWLLFMVVEIFTLQMQVNM